MTVQRPPAPDATATGGGRTGDPLRGLGDALVDVQAAGTIPEVLRAVADNARRIVGAELAACSLTDPLDGHQTDVTVASGAGIDPALVPDRSPWYGPAIDRSDVLRLGGESLHEHLGLPATAAVPVRGWLLAPLTARDGASIGVLQVASTASDGFSDLDSSLLLQLARIAAVAIERVRLQEQLEHRLVQLQGLAEAAVTVNSQLTTDEVIERLTAAVTDLVGAELGVTTVAQQDEPDGTVVSVTRAGADLDAAVDSTLAAEVRATNESVRLSAEELAVRVPAGEALPHRNWLAAPLVGRTGENLGLLQLTDKVDGTQFTLEDQAIAEQFAHLAAVTIEKARLYRSQARQDAARFRDELLAGMSHDMQTPLSVIVGIADSLAQDPEMPLEERRDIYPVVARQARRLRSLVNQFLDFSRIEADRPLTLDIQPTDVVEVIDNVVPLFTHQREIIVGAEDGLPRVHADRERFEQILVNLISNAVKYSDGPVRVVARWDGPDVIVDVVDEGPGLGEGELEHIFEKFHRGSTAGGTRGTGLGLYISRALAEAQGGRLLAISRDGHGSRFRVVLDPVGRDEARSGG